MSEVYVVSTENSHSTQHKLKILSAAAKYDVACTSSGINRSSNGNGIGNAAEAGICHSFSADGRCISLLKVLFTNECIYDCKYCFNRVTNDVERVGFTPKELCDLVIGFYRRNYIEGLFLSSGIVKNPDYTMELIYESIRMLREEYNFRGYIHVKAIPGASELLIEKTGFLVDRMSVNLELPTGDGLRALAPNKNRKMITKPMRQIQKKIIESKNDLVVYKNAPAFVPAGQSTQMIIGATEETDYQIMMVSEALYNHYFMKRVFYSAFIPVVEDRHLPSIDTKPPLLREHRLYQADWLLRYYGFTAGELLTENRPNFNMALDPKCDWAVRNLQHFPVEINKADYNTLLRVPGLGVKSAMRIIKARKTAKLRFEDLKKIGVVLKRAVYFITCEGKMMYPVRIEEHSITNNLLQVKEKLPLHLSDTHMYRQMSLFDDMGLIN